VPSGSSPINQVIDFLLNCVECLHLHVLLRIQKVLVDTPILPSHIIPRLLKLPLKIKIIKRCDPLYCHGSLLIFWSKILQQKFELNVDLTLLRVAFFYILLVRAYRKYRMYCMYHTVLSYDTI
jgi:hypothetical protein